MISGTGLSFAETIKDVPESYWAAKSIVDCVNRGYFKLDSNYKFYPNGFIQRAEFLNSLLKVLESDNVVEGAKAYFKDVTTDTKYYNDIAISQNIGIIYGYPDKTFKPAEGIVRSEATSVIANLSKTTLNDTSILQRFQDYGKIPSWALNSYAKVVEDGLYVNHPDPSVLNPEGKMTKAEAAVLFAKMSGDMDLLRAMYPKEYKIEERLISEETLRLYNKAPRDAVKIYNTKKVIEAGNVIVGRPSKQIDTTKIEVGTEVTFYAPQDVYSAEGTLLYNKGAQFTAKVQEVKNSIWLNKQNKALFIFDNATYVTDAQKEMAAVAYTTDRGRVVFVKDSDKNKKYKESSKKLTKGDFLLKYVNKIVPTIKTKIDPTDDVYLLLTGDLIIPEPLNL